MKRSSRIDRPLIAILSTLIVGGAMIFASAAFGLLARGATHMSSVVFSHVVLGIGVGLVALLIGTFVDYRIWRRYAPYIYIFAVIITAAVFIPHVGMLHGGGRRWIAVGGISFQPSEALKLATIIMAASYFAGLKQRVATLTHGVGGLLAILAVPAVILVMQPDIGTFGVIAISVGAIFIAAGARWRDIALLIILGVVALGVLSMTKPYIRERVTTFFNPSQGQQNQAYQIKQSLIAVGSGGFLGRGFGQGIQKFTYLPEPMGDSIFAVAAEELGFVGGVFIVALFVGLILRGYSIGAQTPDMFGALVAIGISTYLSIEAFINIASMLGVAPVTGIPLTFISQGGSAMLVAMGSAGILLNISRNRNKTRT